MTGLDITRPVEIDTGGTDATPDMFGLAYSIAGRPPGPSELARAANRKLISWTGTGAGALSFQQGIAESDVKTKWTNVLEQLAVYVPPPRTVGTLLEHGAIDKKTAISFWTAGGVPATLAEGYAYEAEQQHIGQSKLEAKSDVLAGYYDLILNRDQALGLLAQLGYTGSVADEMLKLQDFRREIKAIDSVVTKVGTLYTSHKLTAANAKTALEQIGLDSKHADDLLGIWEALRVEPVRLPTPSEIGEAFKKGTLTQDEALQELAKLGYQERDAAIVFTAHSGAPIKPLPPAGTSITG